MGGCPSAEEGEVGSNDRKENRTEGGSKKRREWGYYTTCFAGELELEKVGGF